VTSIDPVISKEGDVNIRLRVSGDREKAVQLVRNLETSQRFLSPRLASEQAQTQEGNRNAAQLTAPGAVQFDVLSGYNPLPEKPVKAVAAKDKKDKGDATEGDTGAVKKKRTTPKSALPGAGAVKAPAQKGAAR
jgi:type IV pilus assembly protein PilN